MDESVLKAFGVSVTVFGGYFFLRTSPYRRFLAEHLRTDRFALHVLGFALLSYAFSVVIASITEREFKSGWVHDILGTAKEYTRLETPVIFTVLLAPILGIFDSIYVTLRMHRDLAVAQHSFWKRPLAKMRAAAAARFVLKCDDAATRLLYRATIYRKALMITLKSGKVYVGQPVGGLGDPSVRSHSIKIIPLYSGYRDAVTHKVELPTKYRMIVSAVQLREKEEPANPEDPLARDMADLKMKDGERVEIDMQDMGVVILWSEIQSLTIYDDGIYRAFQTMVPPPEKSRLTLFGKDGLLARLFLS
jgi:hypothetical protein